MTYQNIESKKGFTLIELLVVIGIIAVIATITVIVLNPAELFKQARDTQRIADLSTVRDAIILTLSRVSPTPAVSAVNYTSSVASPVTLCNTAFSGNCITTHANITTVTGNGWVGFDFTDATNGNAITKLPMDPTNSATLFYAYKGVVATGLFKLATFLESAKYLPLEANTSDGGTDANMYEIGTTLAAI